MHRFFIDPSFIENGQVSLTGGAAHQISRVLRARPGEEIVVLDDTGWEHVVRLDEVANDEVRGTIAKKTPAAGEPRVTVTLYQALLKSDSFEFVLQKGTELGVSRFVPMQTTRSVAKAGGPQDGARAVRWRKIIQEAAEQSHRGRLPTLSSPVAFGAASELAAGLAVIPWERETGTGLKTVLAQSSASPAAEISIYTGPEGGFTADEVQQARLSGIVPVTLGKRILRAETAALATVSVVMYELDELG